MKQILFLFSFNASILDNIIQYFTAISLTCLSYFSSLFIFQMVLSKIYFKDLINLIKIKKCY